MRSILAVMVCLMMLMSNVSAAQQERIHIDDMTPLSIGIINVLIYMMDEDNGLDKTANPDDPLGFSIQARIWWTLLWIAVFAYYMVMMGMEAFNEWCGQ